MGAWWGQHDESILAKDETVKVPEITLEINYGKVCQGLFRCIIATEAAIILVFCVQAENLTRLT